jgi:hypothetical protein
MTLVSSANMGSDKVFIAGERSFMYTVSNSPGTDLGKCHVV